MPAKFKPSQILLDRSTGKKKTQHFYMKQTSKKELFDYINSGNAKPKLRQKCLNELIRRGIKIVWEWKLI